MSDQPLKFPAVPSRDGGPRAQDPSARQPDSPAPGEGDVELVEPRDKVELPMTLCSLPDGPDTERVPEGTLPPEQMRQVLRRLAHNAYDSAEARDVIARRLQRDLRLPPASEAT
jgi:hypothetical protein